MNALVLTKVGGILGPFAFVLGLIMNYIFEFLNFVGIPNVGLTIILFTLVVNLLLLPLTIKQQRFTRMSSLINPEIQKIQRKYKGKTDTASVNRMQAETQAVYAKYGSSPTAGCLPMLIQLPILFALYRVIYNIPAYVDVIGDLYRTIAEPIQATAGGADIMSQLMTDLSIRVSGFDFNNMNKIVDALNFVKSTGWDTLVQAFASNPDVGTAVTAVKDTIIHMNQLPGGLNIIDAPVQFGAGVAGFFPGIIIPVLAGVTQYISTRVIQPKQKESEAEENSMMASMRMMNVTMPLISVFFCLTLPSGIGVYWIASSVFRTLSVIIANRYFDSKDLDLLIEENKKIAAKKAERRGGKPTLSERMMGASAAAQAQQENEKQKSLSEIAKANTKKNYKPRDYQASDKPVDTSSIASIAHMLDRKDKQD